MRKRELILVAIILIIGFSIRFYRASKAEFVFDEIAWISIAKTPFPLHGDHHPLLQVYLIKIGTFFLGWNKIGYRLSNIILGTASLYVLYLFTRHHLGASRAIVSTLLLCFNEFHIGRVSSRAVESNYLFFVVLSIYLFWTAIKTDQKRFMLYAGIALGLASLTKEISFFMVPIFGLYILIYDRKWLRVKQLWIGLALVFLMFSPEIYWQIKLGDGWDIHLNRLRLFTFSFGPLSLYIHQFFYWFIEPGENSEYLVMSNFLGILCLAGVLYSLLKPKTDFIRFQLLMFCLIFGFFTFFSTPECEFWWAAITVIPATILASNMVVDVYEKLSCQRTIYFVQV